MDSQEVISKLRELRGEGVKYKVIADNCNINPSSLYEYMRVGKIPLIERNVIIDYLQRNFYEVMNNE